MKIHDGLFKKDQLDALEKIGIALDLFKDYSDDEIADIEETLQDACLDYGFVLGEPNDQCAFWEEICDKWQDAMDPRDARD